MTDEKRMEGQNSPPLMSVPKYQNGPNAPYNYAAIPPKKVFSASKAEIIMALVSYLVAYVYITEYMFISIDGVIVWFSRAVSFNWSACVFTVIFLIWGEAFCRMAHCKKASRESLFWAGCMLVVAFSQGLWKGATIAGWDCLILHSMAAYWVLCRTGCLADHRTGPMFLLDLLNALVLAPFGNFFLRCRTLWYAMTRRLQNKEKNHKIGVILLSILIVFPLLWFVVVQLGQADPAFYTLTWKLTWKLQEWLHRLFSVPAFWLSLPVGAYLYGLFAGSVRAMGEPSLRKMTDNIHANAPKLHRVPLYAITASVTAFCLVYLLFFGVQIRYLTGALQQDLTTAEFARSGFWQLCRVVMLNFVLMLGMAQLCKVFVKESRLLKTLILVLDACNMLFAVVAMVKMGAYIAQYGLTPRRVLASWFMLVLVCFMALVVVAVFRSIPVARVGILLSAGLFALLCISNPDGLVVRTNLRLYQEGIIQQLDTDVLRQCGADKDFEEYLRMLYQSGWLVGRERWELCQELGEPDAEQGNVLYWNAGWNVIDPELLVVTFGESSLPLPPISTQVQIVEGAV